MTFLNKENLYNAHELGGVDENCILYSYEHYLLTNNQADRIALELYMGKCRERAGIHHQYPEMKGTDEDYMSHDQLTTIMNFSYKHGLNWHKEIWSEIKRQKFRYNNINPENPGTKGLLHPRDIIYYAYLNNSIIGYLFFPILMLIMIEATINTKKVRPEIWDRIILTLRGEDYTKRVFFSTDGKLLNFTRIQTCDKLGMRLFGKFIDFLTKKLYGSWARIFNSYFPANHPNSVEASKKYDANAEGLIRF